MTCEQIEQAVGLRKQGTSVQKIAAELGFSYNTVRKELILHGMQ
ncbi:orotate phosphoribosyltransferase-like protein [Glaciihabitans sp. UYNi722]